jgi:hypothetical protein
MGNCLAWFDSDRQTRRDLEDTLALKNATAVEMTVMEAKLNGLAGGIRTTVQQLRAARQPVQVVQGGPLWAKLHEYSTLAQSLHATRQVFTAQSHAASALQNILQGTDQSRFKDITERLKARGLSSEELERKAEDAQVAFEDLKRMGQAAGSVQVAPDTDFDVLLRSILTQSTPDALAPAVGANLTGTSETSTLLSAQRVDSGGADAEDKDLTHSVVTNPLDRLMLQTHLGQ